MGGFTHWVKQKLQTGLLKMHIHSLPAGAFGVYIYIYIYIYIYSLIYSGVLDNGCKKKQCLAHK